MPKQPTTINASEPSGKTSTAQFTAPMIIASAETGSDGNPKARRFSINAYGGGKMRVNHFNKPVVIDLSRLDASNEIPILKDHQPQADAVLGQTESVTVRDGKLYAEGRIFANREAAKDMLDLAAEGFKQQASVGVDILASRTLEAGEQEELNGQTITGPALIVTSGRLREISAVVLGADHTTSTLVAKGDTTTTDNAPRKDTNTMNKALRKYIEAQGWNPDELSEGQIETLKAAWEATKPSPPQTQTPLNATATDDDFKKLVADAKATAQAQAENEQSIKAAARQEIETCPSNAEKIQNLADAAIKAGTPAASFEYDLLKQSHTAPAGIVRHGSNERVDTKTVEAGIAIASRLGDLDKHYDAKTLSAAADQFRDGISLGEMLVLAAKQNGHDIGATGLRATGRLREVLHAAFMPGVTASGSFSSMDISGILSNVANKFVLNAFNAVENSWRDISVVRPVNDFKQITRYSLVEDAEYRKIGPSGELEHGDLGETSYTNKADTYGRLFKISRTDIINDDLGVLSDMGRRIGRGAGLAINKVFWTEWLDNASFFTTGRGNKASGATTALDIDSLSTALTGFKKQTDPKGNPLGIMPRILLTPTELEITGDDLMAAENIMSSGSANKVSTTRNPHRGKLKNVSSTYLSSTAITGNSATAWFLLADPQDLPAIELVALNGRETPTVESAAADFDQLGIQMRGYHDFGASKQEYRAAYEMAGA